MQGKSLSIICGAVKWLLDREEREQKQLQAVLEGKLPATVLQQHTAVLTPDQAPPTTSSSSSSGGGIQREPDWLAAYDKRKAEREALQSVKEQLQRKEKRDARLKKLREDIASSRWRQKVKVGVTVCVLGHIIRRRRFL